jgi:hypothetical protein
MLPPLVLRRGMLMTIWSWMLVVFATPIILPYDRPLFPTHSARKIPYNMRQVSMNETVHLDEQAPLYTMKKLLTRGRYNRRLATMHVACIDAWYEYSQIISLLSLTVGRFPCQATSIQQPLSNGLHLPHRCKPSICWQLPSSLPRPLLKAGSGYIRLPYAVLLSSFASSSM